MVTIAALAMMGVATLQGDTAAALRHQETLDAASVAKTYYLSFACAAEGEDRDNLIAATRLMVASTSRQVVIDRCRPEPITQTLHKIDLRDLKWSRKAWDKAFANYPYSHQEVAPLVVRADWLLSQLADATASPAYYELLLGGAPSSRDAWLAALGVDRNADPFLRYGMVEENSGVAVNNLRWLESFPTTSGYAWGTRDAITIDTETDPLEHPLGDQKHDGEEWIVGIPKLSLATGRRGVLQVYLLSDGRGNRVDRAPINLVEDGTRFRGLAEIRNPGSCIQCHAEGLNRPSENAIANYVLTGAQLYATTVEDRARIEAFHLGDAETAIARANDDFGAMVEELTGLAPKAAASAFRNSIDRYDADLTLEDAARELGVSPATLRNAIAQQTGLANPLPARIAGLAHGRKVSRTAWESLYLTAKGYINAWKD